MSVTYGFYNARNHDRRYNAIQMSSIFDGIINDGIYMSIGDHMAVKANAGMTVTVGTGRAWFNHTWTLNDSLYPIDIISSEVVLNRIDAVVLEVNAEEDCRRNMFTVVSGKPAVAPTVPTLTNTDKVHQYPLAYISVKAGVQEIRQADITNMIGTFLTPFVTGVIQTMEIDSLIAQWEDQWNAYFEKQTSDMNQTNAFWRDQWNTWFESQKREFEETYFEYEDRWIKQFDALINDMNETNASWNDEWATWFAGQAKEFEETYLSYETRWREQFDSQIANMEQANASWNTQWTTWFAGQAKEFEETYLSYETRWREQFDTQIADMEQANASWEEWFSSIKNILESAENGELLEEIRRLYADFYHQATEGDIDRILNGTYVYEEDSSIFETAEEEDIDNIISGRYTEDTEDADYITNSHMIAIVDEAFAEKGR